MIYIHKSKEIIRLFENKGCDFIAKLNGSFLLLIYDLLKIRVIIANDRIGSRPLFYSLNLNRLIFAPEVKALLLDQNTNKKINMKAIAYFLANGNSVLDETYFEDIKQLPPASILEYINGKLEIKRYWQPLFDEYAKDKGEKYYIEELSSLIEKAVEFDQAANGIIGLETAVPLGLKLVEAGIINITDLIEKMSKNPARILGLKIGLEIGKTADITIIDPEIFYCIDARRFQSLSRNTPFDGWDVKGRAVLTMVGGKIVYQYTM